PPSMWTAVRSPLRDHCGGYRSDSQTRSGLIHGVAEWLSELVDHRRRNVKLTLWVRLHLIARSFVSRLLVLHFFLEHADAVNQRFRSRWTARNVNIDRDDGVDSLDHCVVVEHSASRGGGSH